MARKRQKLRKPRAQAGAKEARLVVRLGAVPYQQLGIACAMERKSIRQYLEAAILERSRCWVVMHDPEASAAVSSPRPAPSSSGPGTLEEEAGRLALGELGDR